MRATIGRAISARSLAAALGVAAALGAASAAAQLTLYEGENFHGRSFTASGPVSNLDGTGFNDRASSAIVERGRWELCEHADFGGRCIVLERGQYPSLGYAGLNNQVSSMRRVSGRADYGYAPPPPPPAQPYPYYQRSGETLYQADVVAVRAVVGPPEQRCWVEQQQVTSGGGPNVGGAIIGGILGGVLGHQIGSGRGNDVATAVGAVAGAAVGSNVNRGSPQTYSQDVQRCASVPGSAQPAYWDVTYVFRGNTHRAQLAFAPGPTITVNGRGEPRV
ncbi:MAG TPA: beta/gamma crystallin family protein [Casimicrobiaceae bacterium]|nr:beta/gamma crystallin family protein [Casimicrobiaceae bacterium]